jgi:hypothetical protein
LKFIIIYNKRGDLIAVFSCEMSSFFLVINKVNRSHYRLDVPRGFQEFKVPRLRDSVPGWW